MVTLKLAAITWSIGLSLGGVAGVSAHRWPLAVGVPLRSLTFLLSGVPFLVLLYWAHFPLQTLLNIVVNPFITAATILSIINTVFVAEIWRSALNDFRREYVLAAMTCGMTFGELVRHIQIPLVFRQALPMLVAVQVAMLQMTLFASLISVEELFRVAQRINSSIHKPVEIYSALAIFFLVICIPPYYLAFWMRRRFTRNLSEQ